MSSAEDDFLVCEEKLCRCLKEFKEASLKLGAYIDSTRVKSNINDMEKSMNNILRELEEVKK